MNFFKLRFKYKRILEIIGRVSGLESFVIFISVGREWGEFMGFLVYMFFVEKRE